MNCDLLNADVMAFDPQVTVFFLYRPSAFELISKSLARLGAIRRGTD